LEVYDLAQQNDPTLKQALANQKAIGVNKYQSIASMLPTITGRVESNFNRLKNKKASFQGEGIQEFYEHRYTIDLNQPVFHWDLWVQLSQADNQIAQAEADYLAEQQNLITRATEAYFNILAAQDNLAFTVAEKNAIARQLEQAEQRFEVGLIAITDVHEAQAGYDQVRSDEITAINEVDNAKEALREIISETDASLATLGAKMPLVKPNPADIESWSTNAETQNLTIISAFNEAEVARKNIELQRSGHYPQLDIVASHSESDNNSTFGLRGDQQQVGLQLNVPIFEGGGVYFRTRKATQEHIQAKEKLIATKREVDRQVRDAYRGVISSISRVEALKAAVISGESALEATEAGFDVGTRTMVDVLTATRNLTQARSNHSQARYDYLINGIKLKQSASNLNLEDLQAINSFLH
jgi:outer membrane protein